MMRRLYALFSRFAGLFAGRQADADVDEELKAHLDLHTAENIRRGMTVREARRTALIDCGGLTLAAESIRRQRGLPWIETIAADLRYAWRSLSHNPGFATVAVLTLALGIGANTAIFSVINGVVLRPLPYPAPDRLVSIVSVVNNTAAAVSPPDFTDWSREAHSFSGLAASYSSETILTAEASAERVSQARVTANAFDVLSIKPILGRAFLPGEDAASTPRVAILSEGLWRRRFGADSSIIGRSLTFDGFPTVIVGVA